MKKLKLTKVIASLLIVASVLALNPICASAEWKNNSTGWWYTEGSSWYTGWKLIDSNWYYFNANGYMKTGWVTDFKYNSDGNYEITDETYYYLNSDGSLDNSKTTKTLPSEIKKAYDIIANFEQDYSNNLYFTGINDIKINNFYDKFKQFGFSNDGSYNFEVNSMGDCYDELTYDTSSNKILIVNQGSCIFFDSKKSFDNIDNKAKAINKIREWQRKLNNATGTILNVKENENNYIIEKYNYNIQYNGEYSYNKENGEITNN